MTVTALPLAKPSLLVTAVRFGAVGLLGVVVNEGLLYLLHLRLVVPLSVAAIVATEAAILTNYLCNERFTFSSQPSLGRLLRFQLTALGGLAITLIALRALVVLTPLDVLVANLAAIGAGTVWNFALNVTWTWKGSHA